MDRPVLWGSIEFEEDSFVNSFESCEYPNEKFKHPDHIRLAWIYIKRFDVPVAEERIAASIRKFAAHLGHEEKYHETMTRAWLRLVYAAYCATPTTNEFGKFIGSHLWLADKNALQPFYSHDLLASDQARRSWVEPDLQSLPGGPTTIGNADITASRPAVS